MAKQAKEVQTNISSVFPEDLKKVGSEEKDVLFWDFKTQKTIHCVYLEKVNLEYDCYLVKEITSQNKYYLPAHTKIQKAIEKYGTSRIYGITLVDTVKFDNGKKTYNSYDIDYYEIPK